MSAGKIPPNRKPLTTEDVRNAQAAALAGVKLRTGMSAQSMAERMGKSDRKTAEDYLAGASTMDLAAFAKALTDPDFGPMFGNDVLRPIAGFELVAGCIDPNAAADESMPVAVSSFLTALMQAFTDKHLDHQEILALAKMLRPLMPKLQFIVAEADRISR